MKKNILSLCFACFAFSFSAQSVTEKDRQFAMDATQAEMLEIKLGELTISKANLEEVKQLGQRMIVDHTKVNNELKALALSKNIVLPTELTKDGQKCYNDLVSKSGSDFDKAFTRAMVKHHEKAVASFKSENLENSDVDLRNWASVTLPVLEYNLVMSKDADLKVNNGKLTSSK